MNLTISDNKLKSSKYINGETVNYSICFFVVSMFFIAFKQLLKIAFSLSAPVSVAVSFAISAAVLFILNKKFVFNHKQNGSVIKQIIMYLINIAVDLGFFKITQFVFKAVSDDCNALAYIVSALLICFFNFAFQKLLVFDCRENAKNNKNGREG